METLRPLRRFAPAGILAFRFGLALIDARAIETPPFFAYPLRPGITFTYLGVAVDERARMILQDARPAHNIFAAGEIMAGNVLGKGYIAGIGMAIGTAFGRIAGEEAARHVVA